MMYGTYSTKDPTGGTHGGMTTFSIVTPEVRFSNDYQVAGNPLTQERRKRTVPGYRFKYIAFFEHMIGHRYLLVSNKASYIWY
jgi:hypothetical protein